MSQKTEALQEKLLHLDLLPPIVVEEGAPYGEVLASMREKDRGSVIVCRGGAVSGVFTERDVLNRCVLESPNPRAPVSGLMTPRPFTLPEGATVGQAVELMHSKGVRNIPIVDAQGRPKGLITVGRVIRYLADHYPAEVVNLPPTLHQISSQSEGA